MRVTSELWIAALVRRVFSSGGFAAIVRRGAVEAGAVFLISRDRFGEQTLFGPAPQTSYESARPDERHFVELIRSSDEEALAQRLTKEARFDPDIWVVELEPGAVKAEELFAIMKPSG
jgi:hypothetical protein